MAILSDPPVSAAPNPLGSQHLPVLNDSIDDVNKDVNQIFFRRNKNIFLMGLLVSAAWEALILFWLSTSALADRNDARLILLGLPLLAFVAAYLHLKNKIRHQFMGQFAQANNYTYQQNGRPDNLTGTIFSVGHSPAFQDLISGQYQKHNLNLFNYVFVTGSGKSSQTHYNTIIRIEHGEQLPSILLIAGSRFLSQLSPNFAQSERLTLEGDFNKYFTLYTRKEFEIEALQIFSPDFMEKTKDNYPEFSLEFTGSQIYIYYAGYIETKTELQKIYGLAEYLIAGLQPLLTRMESEIKAMDAQFKVN